MAIDIIRTSTSRPEILQVTTEALQEHLIFDGKLRYLIHEDCVETERSNACMEYITDSGIYDVYQQDIPHLGQGKSFF